MASAQTVVVKVLDANNNPLPGRTVALSNSNPAVVSVPASCTSDVNGNASYLATAVGLGTAVVTETCEGKTSTTTFPVGSSETVATIQVSPGSTSLIVGGTVALTAQPLTASGSPLSDDVAWSSSDDSIATVDDSGLVTAVAAGSATITATDGTVTGSAAITVSAATLTRQLWWSPDTLSLTDGQAVTAWADKVGGVSASQTTGAAKPAFRANVIGGHAGVDFELGDQLRFTMPAGDSAQISRYAAVHPGTSTPVNDMVLWSTPMASLRIKTNGAIEFIVVKTGALIVDWRTAAGVVTLDEDHVIGVIYDASALTNNPTIRLDGATVAAPLFSGAQSGTRVADAGTSYLGTDASLSREVLGPMGEIVFLASVADSSSEETRLLTEYAIA